MRKISLCLTTTAPGIDRTGLAERRDENGNYQVGFAGLFDFIALIGIIAQFPYIYCFKIVAVI